MKKIRGFLALLAVLLPFAAAQTAAGYVYPGFAEIHETVALPEGSWTWFPSEALASSLVNGTVRLLGVEEERRVWRRGVVTFYYTGGGQATLAYLTRNLTYGLYYDLDVDRGRLVGWAQLDNRLGRTLHLDRLTFVAGEVSLREGSVPVMAKSARSYEEMAVAAPAPQAPVFAGSGGGVFRYELAAPPPLEPGLNELPFARATVNPAYTWSYNGGFVRGDRVIFRRGYVFEAPMALAGGVVNVREGGVLLGQAEMGERAMGDRVRLWLGRDPEGKARRQVEVLKDEREEKVYRVTTSVTNPRAQPVRVEFAERFNAREIVLRLPAGAERTPQGYRLAFTLAPGEARSFVYTVTLRY